MTTAVKLPLGPRWPVAIQGLAYIAARQHMMQILGKRYGTAFNVRLPFFGPTVVYRRIHSGVEGRAKDLQSAIIR